MPRRETTEYRVYGPPGTGKTTHIATQVPELVERFGADQVSICSLTNTAVREAVGRDMPLPPENVSTLHARCKRSLNAPAPAESMVGDFIKAYPKYATEECLPPALRRVRYKDGEEPETIDEVKISGSREPTLYERVQILRQQLVPIESWHPTLKTWYLAWADFMDQSGHLDFTGWLEMALEQRSLPPQQMVFVDEAQDHTPLQLAVIRGWQTRHRVLVGDDDQNLYEWSGAIPDRFFNPALPEGREKVLSQSYRVPRSVHAVADRYIKQIRVRKEKAYFPRDADGAVRAYGYGLQDAEWGNLPWQEQPQGSVMFLTSAGYMLDPIINMLREHGILYHNPFRRSNAKWNPLTSVGEVLDLFMKPYWTGREAHTWMKVLRSVGVYQTGRRKAALEWLAERPRQDIYVEDLAQFLLPETVRMIDDEDIELFRLRRNGLIGNWDYAIDIYKRTTPEQRDPQVIVGTIHSVKGGQADHVYLFPDLSPAAYQASTKDALTRLFYVGMTRSYETLTLGEPKDWRAVRW